MSLVAYSKYLYKPLNLYKPMANIFTQRDIPINFQGHVALQYAFPKIQHFSHNMSISYIPKKIHKWNKALRDKMQCEVLPLYKLVWIDPLGNFLARNVFSELGRASFVQNDTKPNQSQHKWHHKIGIKQFL